MAYYFNIFRYDNSNDSGGFEDTLSQVALLAAFIPIISGMSGNSGTQSLAVSVRNISNGDIKEKVNLK